MSNTNKDVYDIIILDNDSNVPESESVVCKFSNIVSSDDQQTMLLQLVVDHDIKGILAKYNEDVRGKLFDKETLRKTGQKVKLEPVLLKDLSILVK